MVKEQATRVVLKQLKAAGFSPARTVGSHTMWVSVDGKVQVSVPDGHRTISPGVYRKVLKALEEAGK
ncbi:addiction module toxin, HicA family [Rhodococcus hoagii]|nr:addiction module toxin, HicA family [Prescottella equi]NKS10238.1 addiction module toxin, HicA family [Prescottella equi]NKS35229.1 addiction module toxin, HicA family [Prescottella equi]NKS62076.1 addiction module toxin, HicA family [Prescottella equi]NKS68254.1 addiction module toxin, HicA family [Prescottella equi]